MDYWSWGTGSKLAALGVMVGLSTAAMFIFSWYGQLWLDPRWLGIVIGGVSFLTIPQMMALFLFIGFSTGRIPYYHRSVTRADQPFDYWSAVVGYGSILVFYIYFFARVFADASR